MQKRGGDMVLSLHSGSTLPFSCTSLFCFVGIVPNDVFAVFAVKFGKFLLAIDIVVVKLVIFAIKSILHNLDALQRRGFFNKYLSHKKINTLNLIFCEDRYFFVTLLFDECLPFPNSISNISAGVT